MLNHSLPLQKHTLPSKLKHKMLNPILPLHKHTLLSKLKHIHHTSRHSKHSLNTDVQNGKHYSMNGKHFMNDQENYTFACSCCRLAFSPFVKYPNIKQQKCSKRENIILYPSQTQHQTEWNAIQIHSSPIAKTQNMSVLCLEFWGNGHH